jgi:transcription initiation factor TFIID TATA-box-binding protein
MLKIVNIVCSGTIFQKFDLQQIEAPVYRYDHNKNRCGYLCFPKCKVLLFKSGKYQILGLTSVEDIKSTLKLVKKTLKPFIVPEKINLPRVINIVGLINTERKIPLIKLLEKNPQENIEYEPEQFPGLILRKMGCTALIFSNGKILLNGLTDIDDMKKISSELITMIDKL